VLTSLAPGIITPISFALSCTHGTPGIAANSGSEGLNNGKNKSKKQDDGFPRCSPNIAGNGWAFSSLFLH
jgi:hypothetical protein